MPQKMPNLIKLLVPWLENIEILFTKTQKGLSWILKVPGCKPDIVFFYQLKRFIKKYLLVYVYTVLFNISPFVII